MHYYVMQVWNNISSLFKPYHKHLKEYHSRNGDWLLLPLRIILFYLVIYFELQSAMVCFLVCFDSWCLRLSSVIVCIGPGLIWPCKWQMCFFHVCRFAHLYCRFSNWYTCIFHRIYWLLHKEEVCTLMNFWHPSWPRDRRTFQQPNSSAGW